MKLTIESVANGFSVIEHDIESRNDDSPTMREDIRILRGLYEDIRVFRRTREDVRSVYVTPDEVFLWLYRRLFDARLLPDSGDPDLSDPDHVKSGCRFSQDEAFFWLHVDKPHAWATDLFNEIGSAIKRKQSDQ